MVNRKRFSLKKYFLVLLITILIFVSGMLMGSYFNSQKMNDLELLQRDLTTSSFDNELQYLLIEDAPCDYVNSTPVLDELYELSTKLDFMESLLGPKNVEVLRLKSYYSLLQIRYWRFMNKINSECDRYKNNILYFYSNDGDCPSCEEQGYVLTYIRKKYPNVQVYSFDSNLNLGSIEALKLRFDINQTPSIVINGNLTHNGFMQAREIIDAFNE